MKKLPWLSTKYLVTAALIAGIYLVLAIVFAPISFGVIQFRISEVLTVLPAVTSSAIPGLFIGCLISNIIGGGLGIWDIVLGSLATLVAAYFSRELRKNKWFVPLPPVIVNAVVVGTYLVLLIPNAINFTSSIMIQWLIYMACIGFGQLVVCYGLGIPLLYLIEKNRSLRKIFENS